MPHYPTLQSQWKTKPTQGSTETRLLEGIKLEDAWCVYVCVLFLFVCEEKKKSEELRVRRFAVWEHSTELNL